jgi:hypothetical protein
LEIRHSTLLHGKAAQRLYRNYLIEVSWDKRLLDSLYIAARVNEVPEKLGINVAL